MSKTIHDTIRAAIIQEQIENGTWYESFDKAFDNFWTPEKYQRMWKKITGKDITIEEAKIALNQNR